MSDRVDVLSIGMRVQQLTTLVNSEEFLKVHVQHQFRDTTQEVDSYLDLTKLVKLAAECLEEVYEQLNYVKDISAEKLAKDLSIELYALENGLKLILNNLFTYRLKRSERIYK